MKHMTDKECSDSGLALIFIALLVALVGKFAWAVPVAAGLTLLLMISARPFAPFARLWLGLSHLLGTVMSKVLLTVVFFTVVLPIGLVRRVGGADAMKRKQFKDGGGSVFRVRDKTVTPDDLEHMF